MQRTHHREDPGSYRIAWLSLCNYTIGTSRGINNSWDRSDRLEAIAIDFHSNRALKQVDGDYEATGVFEHGDDTFGAGKRTVFDTDALTDLNVRPRLATEVGLQDRTDVL